MSDSHGSKKPPESRGGFGKKVSVIMVSRAIGVISQLLALVVLTRLLSKEAFGLISFLLLVYSTVLTVGQLGLPESVFYFFEKVSSDSRKAVALQTGKTLFLISIFCALALVGFRYAAQLWGRDLQGLLWPFVLLVVLELPTLPMPNILIALDKTKAAGLLNITVGVSQLLALVLPVLLGYPLAFVIYSLLAYGTVRFLVSGYLFLKAFDRHARATVPKGMLLEQLKYAIPLSIAQITWGLNRQIDKYMVEFFFTPVVFAEYIVGAWEIPLIGIVASSFAAVMMPKLVSFYLKEQKQQLLELWNDSIRKVSVIVLPLVVLFLIVAEEFIVLLASEKYLAAAVPFRIYTVIIIQRVATYSSLMKAVNDTKTVTRSAIYLLIVNTVLNFPLIFMLGVVGPPLATLIANLFSWGYALTKIKNRLNVRLGQVFPFPFYIRTLLVATLAALPILLLKYQLDFSYHVRLLLLTPAYFVTYAIVASLTGVVRRDQWVRLLVAVKLKPAQVTTK